MNPFDSKLVQLKVFGIVIRDQALAWPFMWWMQLPAEREAGILHTSLDASRHMRPNGGKRNFATYTIGAGEQHGLDDEDPNAYADHTDVDASEEDDMDIPEEVEANHEVTKLEQMLGRAKGRQRDARATRWFHHESGPKGSGKGPPAENDGGGKRSDKKRINRLQAHAHCAICSKLGNWRSDRRCTGNPKGGRSVNLTTENDTVGDEDRTPASFFIQHQNFMMTRTAYRLSSFMQIKEELLEQCAGECSPMCAKCVAGQHCHCDMKNKVKRFRLKQIERSEREACCFGA